MWNGRELEQKVANALDQIGKGAAALTEAGATVYTVSSAVQKKGLIGFLQSGSWKDECDDSPPAPVRTIHAKSKSMTLEPHDEEEKRAILQLCLSNAMAEQDISRVQRLSRELDEFEGYHARSAPPDRRKQQAPGAAPLSDERDSHVDTQTSLAIHERSANSALVHSSTNAGVISSVPPDHAAARGSSMHAQPQPYSTDTDVTRHAHDRHCLPHCSGQRSVPPEYVFRQTVCELHCDQDGGINLSGTSQRDPSSPYPPRFVGSTNIWVGRPMAPSGASYEHGHDRSEGRMATPPRLGAHWYELPDVSKLSSERVVEEVNMGSESIRVGMNQHDFRSSYDTEEPIMAGLPPRQQFGAIVLPGPQNSGSCSSSTYQLFHTFQTQANATISLAPFPSMHASHSSMDHALQLAMQPVAACHHNAICDPQRTMQNQALYPAENKHDISEFHTAQECAKNDGREESGGDETPLEESILCARACPQLCQGNESAVQSGNRIESRPQELQNNSEDNSNTGLPPLPDVYEVENVMDMRFATNGKREFLIKWRGWGPSWNSWEPEDYILDRRLLRKFNNKKREADHPAAEPAHNLKDTVIDIRSKRRCAKEATIKARTAVQAEEGEK